MVKCRGCQRWTPLAFMVSGWCRECRREITEPARLAVQAGADLNHLRFGRYLVDTGRVNEGESVERLLERLGAA